MKISSEEEMINLGYRLSGINCSGLDIVLSLQGDLGAGKTHFTKGIAKGLGIEDEITSPTFSIVHEFEGKTPLLHIDFYRLSEDELQSIDLEEIIESWKGWTVVEWGNLHAHILPQNHISVVISIEESNRTIVFQAKGTIGYVDKVNKLLMGLMI